MDAWRGIRQPPERDRRRAALFKPRLGICRNGVKDAHEYPDDRKPGTLDQEVEAGAKEPKDRRKIEINSLIAELRMDNESMKTDLSSANSKAKKMAEANEILERNITDTKIRFDKLRMDNESTRRELESTTSKISNMNIANETFGRNSAELRTQFDKLRAENETTKRELASASLEIGNRSTATETLEREAIDAKTKLNRLQMENETLKGELKLANSTTDDAKKAIKILKTEATDTSARFDKLRVENESLRKNLASANSKIASLDRDAADTKVQFNKLRMDNDNLKRDLGSTRKVINEVRLENESLKGNSVAANSRIQALDRDISNMKKKLDSLTATSDTQREELDSVCDQIYEQLRYEYKLNLAMNDMLTKVSLLRRETIQDQVKVDGKPLLEATNEIITRVIRVFKTTKIEAFATMPRMLV